MRMEENGKAAAFDTVLNSIQALGRGFDVNFDTRLLYCKGVLGSRIIEINEEHTRELVVCDGIVVPNVSKDIKCSQELKGCQSSRVCSFSELCSMTFVAGLAILLRSATKITHKAQSVTCLAAKWHICATLDSFDNTDGETPRIQVVSDGDRVFPANINLESDDDTADGDEDDDIDNTRIIFPAYTHTICFQKRQALVTYFENNRAGITVFGFMLDRTLLHAIFGVEMSLVLWLLGKTVGI